MNSTSSVTQSICKVWPTADWADVHVAVAISGGCDSMALLRALLQIKAEIGGEGKIFALHVNHQLRGADSEQDAQWCQQQCDSLGVPLTILRGTAADRAEQDGDGIEAAARTERYELITTATEQAGARYLAIAHTQNDQVETIMFRLLRGSGLRGIAGIPRSRPLTPSVTLVRPLLDCTRDDLESYLASLTQSYRSDESNTERRFARNRVRHDLLPKLREDFNQNVDGALLRLATQADEVQCYLEVQAQVLLDRCDLQLSLPTANPWELSLDLVPLRSSPSVIACEALRLAWRLGELPEQSMTYGKWQQLTQLAEPQSGSLILNLPGAMRASVSSGRLTLQWEPTPGRSC